MSHCEPGGGVALETSQPRVAGKISTVALIGPPNSGKSTLFNRLTGLRQKVANYPGVTVEQHSARMSGIGHRELTLIDLPGIYSLNSYSEDARVAVDVLQGNMPGTPGSGRGAAGAGCTTAEPPADAGCSRARHGFADSSAAEYV